MSKTTAVILAAGLGTRMKSHLPKVLHQVGGKPSLERVVDNLKKAGVDEIIAVIGHKSELVEELFKDKIKFVHQKELLGSADALKQATPLLGEKGNVIVTCGDTPLIPDEVYRDMLESHLSEGASCTLLTCRMDDPASYGRIFREETGEVLKIVEEKDLATDRERQIKEINVGSYCFKNADVKNFISSIEVNEKKKEFYLTDIVEILKREGKKIIARSCSSEESVGINSRKDLSEANMILNKKTLDNIMASGVSVVDPANTYIDDSAVIGKDTVILPGTVIEADVKVGEACRIGPFAHIRPGSVLAENVEVGNFVELNRTSLGKGTKVKHQAYLGDTCAGENVNIGAGVITANYDGKEKHKTIIHDEAFIGIGARLVAPVEVGKGAVLGAGSVVTKNKNVKAGEVVAGVPAKPLKAA